MTLEAQRLSMPVPAEISQVDPTLHVLERMVRDPSIPVERIERVMALIDSRATMQAKRQFSQAMALAQEEMRPIATDCVNPQTKSRYASLAAVDRAIRKIYSKHGLFPSFNTAPSEQGPEWVKVLCEVAHSGGYSREYAIDMPADGKGARGNDVMTKTHATGSATTYGRRYLLMMIFNLSVEDDDGNAAANKAGNSNGHHLLNSDQMEYVWQKAREITDEEGVARWVARLVEAVGYKTLVEVPQTKYADMQAKIANFAKAKADKLKEAGDGAANA